MTNRFSAATVLLACAGATLASVPNYDGLEVQVRSGAASGFNIPALYSISNSQPVINNNSTVALRVFSPGAMSVWFGDAQTGGIVHQTADTEAIIGNVAMNDADYLVWAETFGNNASGVWEYSQFSGAAFRTNRPLGTSAWTALDVDNAGTIALRASFVGNYAYATVDAGNGVTFFAEDDGINPTSDWTFLFTPAYNNADQIAGKVQLRTGAALALHQLPQLRRPHRRRSLRLRREPRLRRRRYLRLRRHDHRRDRAHRDRARPQLDRVLRPAHQQ